MKILFVGDIMPGGLFPYRNGQISDEILRDFKAADLRIGTLESAIGTDLPFDREKMASRKNIIYSRNEDFNLIEKLNINVVSLANNHSFDLGKEGLENTIRLLRDSGIKYCGAGMNLEEAAKPAVLELSGKTIAIYAYCQNDTRYIGYLKAATETQAGVNPLDIGRCIKDIKLAKEQYDYVFVLPHWGTEYQFLPPPVCVEWAKQMIEAGADGIIGSHTHQIQPLIKYEGRPIAYSLGNFLFPDYYMQVPRPIWYPEPGFDDIKLPIIHYYPLSIDAPCIQEWRHLSRIGMIVSYIDSPSSGHTEVSYRLTYLDRNENLEYYKKAEALRIRMKWMGFMINLYPYNFWFRVYNSRLNIPRRAFHFITRKLDKSNI